MPRPGTEFVGRQRLRRQFLAVTDWLIGVRDVVLAALPRRDRSSSSDSGPCSTLTIVVLPGILENARYLHPLISDLRRRGHRVVTLATLGWNVYSLNGSVERALSEVGQLSLQGAVLVAHSKGGLIGKAMLLDDRSDGVIDGMVAIATPFSGSVLWDRAQRTAAVRYSPLGLFHPDNADLSALAERDAVNSRIVSLAPHYDQVVTGGSYLEGATNIELDAGGHFGSVREPSTWEVVHTQVHDLHSRVSRDATG